MILISRLPWSKENDPEQVRFERLLKLCESPIERLFWQTGYRRLSRIGHFAPQTKIGPYRVDFTLTNIPGVPLLKMVIELEGHEYHSTPKQRNYDTKREWYLMHRGWQVGTFTGARINRECRACVLEVEGLIREWARWLRC